MVLLLPSGIGVQLPIEHPEPSTRLGRGKSLRSALENSWKPPGSAQKGWKWHLGLRFISEDDGGGLFFGFDGLRELF